MIKIKEHHPTAKLVIRIRVDDSKSFLRLGEKFGVEEGLTRHLIKKVTELEMNLIGVAFHVGSGCWDANSFYYAIKMAREVFDEAEDFNIKLKLLDIGGGFPGSNDLSIQFEQFAKVIN